MLIPAMGELCSEAREQMNVLLDTLAVLKLPYLTTTTVLDPMQGDVDVTASKQFHWITRRKVPSPFFRG